jgi:Fe-S oxidoreductase
MPFIDRGMPVIGLEPSCIFSFRDELPALLKSEAAKRVANRAVLFEEFLAGEAVSGKLKIGLSRLRKRALLHGHCHQKSFGAMPAIEAALKLIPGLDVETIESSCCGMAGAFGYHAQTIEISQAMAELSLLPAIREANNDDIIVADGTSCRHQIRDGTGREALHVVRVLAAALL